MDKKVLINEFEKADEILSTFIDSHFRSDYSNAILKMIYKYYDCGDLTVMKGIVLKEENVFFLNFIKELKEKMCEIIISAMKIAGEEDESVALSYCYLAESNVDEPELIPMNPDFDFSSVKSESERPTYQRESYKPSAKDLTVSGVSVAIIVGGILAQFHPVAKAFTIAIGVGGLAYEGAKCVKVYKNNETIYQANKLLDKHEKQEDKTKSIIKSICLADIRNNANLNAESFKKWTQAMFSEILSKARN